jgi:4-amino-4-deoxy-L-arabinose transferase-like glycosyltransferase
MSPPAPRSRHWLIPALLGLGLIALALWVRWPGLDFNVWNVDEAIHAAAARTLLDGGVLYRDAIDQRTPLSYYAVAGIFAAAGENNLTAVRAFIAVLIAGTAWLLYLAGRNRQRAFAGGCAALCYVLLGSSLLAPGDANAANTEWFMAFFSTAAAAIFLTAPFPGKGRTYFTGALLGCAFLSKQPALLELAAPAAALGWLAWQRTLPLPVLGTRLLALAGGWLTPVLLTAAYFAAHHALADGIFYSWTYNLSVYGSEIGLADRGNSLGLFFTLLAQAQVIFLVLWLAGAAVLFHRLMQRQPTSVERETNHATLYLTVWSLAAIGGAVSGGRDFQHYFIQVLPALALGGGFAIDRAIRLAKSSGQHPAARLLAALAVAGAGLQLVSAALTARQRTLPSDSSLRVSTYIRNHSTAGDRIFVWGFHPDIYLYSDRKPASRYLYATFQTGLVPWTNTNPDRDTAYAIIPGAMDTLLRDLAASSPLYIVDCSAGPNRHWQKYPLDKYPDLYRYIREHYRIIEAHLFVPQGFRLFQRRSVHEPAESGIAVNELPQSVIKTLAIGTLGSPLRPLHGRAPNGAAFVMSEGRAELFAHAPSALVYAIPAGTGALRGGFGIKPGAYAPDHTGTTDGAEFIVRWVHPNGTEEVLWRRLLQPHESTADRGIQSFRVEFPSKEAGELILQILPGPNDNPVSDWTFWCDLTLENFR